MSVDPDSPAFGADGGRGPGEADRVLLLALRAWAPGGRATSGGPGAGHPHARLLARLGPSWAQHILDGQEGGTTVGGDRAEAMERLRAAHRTEARVDLVHVHPSWLARGLRDESPAVRRAVVSAATEPIRSRVQAELLLDNDDLRAERPADPDVLAWARSLCTERLVGGEPRGVDDPPVIVAMAGLSPRGGYRLCRYCGEIKLALAGERRIGWATAFAASAGPEFAVISRHDVRSTPTARRPPRRLPARIGLLTIARLLADCEPFRARWALQHWPYAIAKLVRTLTPPAAKRSPVMMSVESEVLKAAGNQLNLEAWPN